MVPGVYDMFGEARFDAIAGDHHPFVTPGCSSGGYQLRTFFALRSFRFHDRYPMRAARLTRREKLLLLELTLTGNVAYFILLALAVQLAGVAVAALINGLVCSA